MDMSNTVKLVSVTIEQDAIGQEIPTETQTEIFCQVESVTGTEWFEAGRNGINSQHRITVYADEYSGERTAILNGTRYGIYRTYERKDGMIELYLEKKAGE